MLAAAGVNTHWKVTLAENCELPDRNELDVVLAVTVIDTVWAVTGAVPVITPVEELIAIVAGKPVAVK